MEKVIDIHDPAFAESPFEAYEYLREHCPAFHDESYGGFTLLTRYEDVRAAALDWRTYTSSVPGVTAIPVITYRDRPQLPIELDPPVHSAYRAIVNPLFAPARLAELRPKVEALSEQLMTAILDRGSAEYVQDYTNPFSVGTLGLFTGLPTEDATLWHAWLARMFNPKDPAGAKQATQEFGAYIGDLIRKRQAEPADDVVSRLLAARVEERLLTFEEVSSYMTVIFGAGFETTSDAMSGTLHWLSEAPGRLDAIRALDDKISLAVEEFVRFVSPIQMFGRNATKDVEVHGCPIHKGAIVALGFGAANRDPRVFEKPEELNPARTPNRHLSFGAGPHLCLGAPIARMEMEIMLRQLCANVAEIERIADDPPRWKHRGDRRGVEHLPLRFHRR